MKWKVVQYKFDQKLKNYTLVIEEILEFKSFSQVVSTHTPFCFLKINPISYTTNRPQTETMFLCSRRRTHRTTCTRKRKWQIHDIGLQVNLLSFFEITSELAIIKLSWVRGHNHGPFRFTKIHQSITVYCMCYFFGNILSPFYFDSYISPWHNDQGK